MKKFLMISLILLAIFLSSGSAFAWWRLYGHFGVFITPPPIWVAPPPVYYRGYYPRPVTMDQIIITMILIESGSLATGRIGGLPMVGKGSGFQAIGNTALNGQKIA